MVFSRNTCNRVASEFLREPFPPQATDAAGPPTAGRGAISMRIAYLSILPPPGEPAVSGVHKVSETLLKEFETYPGLEVDAVTMIDDLARECTIQRGHVRVHYLSCKPRGKTWTFFIAEIRRLKARVRELGAGLIHGQPTAEYLLAATECGLPHVITIHGLVSRESAGKRWWQPEMLANEIRERVNRKAIARAANIISISPYVEDYLRGRTNARIWPVPNPIDREFFDVPEKRLEGLNILCVGIVSSRKNQELLIRACATLQRRGVPFQCRVVGKFSPGYEDKIKELVRDSGLGSRVEITGPVSKADLLAAYDWATAVALPSREETSPLSLIQGLAARRPVFGADSAGIPKLINHGAIGTLFDGEDAETLAARLSEYHENPEPFREKARLGRIDAEKSFHPIGVARQTVETYRRILAGG